MEIGGDVDVVRRVLEREVFMVAKAFPPGKYATLSDLRVGLSWEAKALVLRLAAGVYKDVVARDTAELSVSVPAGWWQAFRQRWAPAWWLRRWPVVMRTEKATYRFEVGYLLPKLYVAPPGAGDDAVLTYDVRRTDR
jgi:hypothetical protein